MKFEFRFVAHGLVLCHIKKYYGTDFFKGPSNAFFASYECKLLPFNAPEVALHCYECAFCGFFVCQGAFRQITQIDGVNLSYLTVAIDISK